MSDDQLDKLLAEAGWLRRLSFSLVGDETHADDLTQDTWVASLRSPPRPSTTPRSWLRGVARRLAARSHRTDARRTRREWRSARPDTQTATDLVERAELQQRVAAAVLALAEPYRETVLMRFYEECTPGDIARRQGLPLATVRTRLRRGLAQLREGLDAEFGGDRNAWTLLMLPLATSDALAATNAMAATTLTTTTETAGTAATASTTLMPATIGALGGFMMSKSMAVTVVLLAVMLGAGFGLGQWLQEPEVAAAPEPTGVDQAEYDALVEENTRLAKRISDIEAERDEIRTTSTARIAELEAEQSAEPVVAEAVVELTGEDLAIAFGEHGNNEALRNADWDGLAGALRVIDEEVAKLIETLRDGGQMDPETQGKLMQQNVKLQEFAIAALGKTPSHMPGSGDFCHPAALANMMASYLELGEQPLTDAQRATIADYGDAYDARWAEAQEGYDDDTLRVQKLLDELTLKDRFVKQFHESLDLTQQRELNRDSFRDLYQMDALSPAVMLTTISRPVTVKSADELRAELVKQAATSLGMDSEQLRNLPLFDTYTRDVSSLLEPVPVYMQQVYSLDEAVLAGRAQQRAMESIADSLQLDEETYQALIATGMILVPRVIETAK